MFKKWLGSCSALVLALTVGLTTVAEADSGAKNTKEKLYIGGMDYVFAVDPETREVTNIEVPGPARDMTWTRDGRTLFANVKGRQSLAVIDTITEEMVDELEFRQDGYTSRIFGFDVDPKGEFIYVTVMRSKIEGVEFKVAPPAILVMDLKTKEIVKEIEVPYGTHTLQFYEDGTKIAVWGRDLREYDIEKDEFKVVKETMYPADTSEGISNYLYFWYRDKESDFYSMSTNYKFYPETGKDTEGFVAWDLKTGEVKMHEFEEEATGLFSGVMSKDRTKIYSGMNYLLRTDVATMKHDKVVPTKMGSSYGFNLSGDDKTIYVSGGGADVSFYDAETLEFQGLVDLPTDTMDLRVVTIELED